VTEDEAREWVAERFGADAGKRLDRLATLVTAEAERQNLIARSTLNAFWARHIVDSAQLLTLAALPDGRWIDIGTGAGFPGLVAAVLRAQPITLIEPRRKRATFLADTATALDLPQVEVVCRKVEQVTKPAAIISARAVASIDAIFAAALPCARSGTVWLLPKGRSAQEEVAAARRSWQALFHVEQSLTDPESLIVMARKVTRR